MKLGFAVKVIGRSGLRSHDTRRWQSNPSLGESISSLHAIFDYLDQIDVRMYRMASAIAPLETEFWHPSHSQCGFGSRKVSTSDPESRNHKDR